jgi:hypothetical protein
MLAKHRVSVVLASACLFGVVAGGAVFAQDAVDDEVIILLPNIDAAVDDTAAVADPDPAIEVAAPDPAVGDTVQDPEVDVAAVEPEAVEPARATLAIPPLGEETGYEHLNDDELADNAASASQQVSYLDASIADATDTGNCEGLCSDFLVYLNEERDHYQDISDHMHEEIRRRQPVVVVTPEPTPEPTPQPTPEPTPVAAPAPIAVRDVTADATPPEGFCASLKASGSWSDCGWSYKQSLK